MPNEIFEVHTDSAQENDDSQTLFENQPSQKCDAKVKKTQEQTRVELVKNGIAVPILENDWEVDRTAQTVARQLGITHLEDMQDAITSFCTPENKFAHIHKGPGNGELMHKMRHSKRGENWEQIGIGDRLYFEIEKVLAQFLKTKKYGIFREAKNIQARNCIHLISQAIAQEIKRRKDAGESNISLNVIFELLRNPSPWIRNWLDMKRRTYRTGGEFENEIMCTLDDKTFQFFRICQGELSPQQITHQIDTRRRKRKKMIGKKLNELLHARKKEQKKNPAIEAEIQQTWEDLQEIKDDQKHLKTCRKYMDPPRTTRISTTQFFEHFFSEDFMHEKIDLDNHADIYPEGFIQGFFTDMPHYFAPDSTHLITGVRSDSHETDEDFERDITQNLDLLAPGGMLITDGARASYWRIHRFEQIARAISKKQNAFHIDVILDTQTGLPKSVMIQKHHPQKGFFTTSQKAKFLHPKSEIESFEKTLNRTDIQITNDIRSQRKEQGKPKTPQEAQHFRQANDTIEKIFTPLHHRAIAATATSQEIENAKSLQGEKLQVREYKSLSEKE